MGRYAIVWDYGRNLHAGSKAPSDAIAFLLSSGYEPVVFRETRTFKYFLFPFYFFRAYRRIETGSRVVFQFPVHAKSTFRVILRLALCLERKKVERIALIHDINFGRGFGSVKAEETLRQLGCFSSLIVHSPQMEALLREHACHLPCRVLGLFDYRYSRQNAQPRVKSPVVVFAGNLSKSGFVSALPSIASARLSFNLYGIGGGSEDSSFVVRKGTFDSSDLSSIEGSWGLVWDGNDIDGCRGSFGEYLKINSPHKASMYVCAELPLIVPAGSAVAEIASREGIGIIVRSLSQIPDAIDSVSEKEYLSMVDRCRELAARLNRGENLSAALN